MKIRTLSYRGDVVGADLAAVTITILAGATGTPDSVNDDPAQVGRVRWPDARRSGESGSYSASRYE